jgi:hypothetical protein
MASPPLAIAGGGAIIVGGTAASLATILFWVGLVLLVIALAILIWLFIIEPLLSKAQPRAQPRTEPRTEPRTKPRPKRRRRRRRKQKPLWWNAGLSYGNVIASGGLPGTLDTRARLPSSAPLHGHHPWPTYVGGPVVQPLMSVRGIVHNTLLHTNSGLHGAMKATALTWGYNISINATHPQNIAFIANLHANLQRRTIFSGVLTAYHAGLNTQCHPPIPAAAYGTGIAYSYPLI